jgi:hypothetical protein
MQVGASSDARGARPDRFRLPRPVGDSPLPADPTLTEIRQISSDLDARIDAFEAGEQRQVAHRCQPRGRGRSGRGADPARRPWERPTMIAAALIFDFLKT